MSFKEYQRRAVVLKGQTLDQWLSITRGFVRNANLSPTFNLLSQNLWGWGPTIHVGESPPSDSGKHEYPGRLVGGHVAILWLVLAPGSLWHLLRPLLHHLGVQFLFSEASL